MNTQADNCNSGAAAYLASIEIGDRAFVVDVAHRAHGARVASAGIPGCHPPAGTVNGTLTWSSLGTERRGTASSARPHSCLSRRT
jgi:hypothetical protein